ncbi:hypothetical protein BT93_D1327 [Corymbia citriodora subsp. variegata]|nr:hypothetical protein BT93_D1327 [Corymbia citriodora subsp. variegata]
MDHPGGRARGGESSAPLFGLNSSLEYDGLLPQLFTSMPSLNEAASYLAQTTSYLTGCFSDYSVESTSEESEHSLLREQELVTFASGRNGRELASNRLSFSESSASCGSSSDEIGASPAVDEITRDSAGSSSANTDALVVSNYTGSNGISMFQSLVERARRTVRGSADDIGWLQRYPGMPPVEDGTEKFTKILDDIRHGIHKLPKSVVYLLVPGISIS